jgi:catechol 2,3-dioxygenase-like lactoylglutathione lyase family enzyme
MRPSGVHHVSICVRAVDEAVAFYTGVLGLTPLPRPDFGVPGAWLDAGGEQVHLIEGATAASTPAGAHFALRVDDLAAAVDDVRAHGVQVDTVGRVPGAGRQAFLRDPSGNVVELNEPDAG